MKKLKAKVLTVVLMALLVLAMGISVYAGNFERSKTYTGHFSDVKASDWYLASVKNAYEFGLMNGTATDKFNPKGMFTVAEAVTIAARMHSIYNGHGGTIPSASGEWYMGAVNYCIENAIITNGQFDDYKKNATRAEMVGIMAAALPNDAWKIINNVESLPDVAVGTPYSEDIFLMYNAGIIGGSDSYGIFQPYAYITRAEVSAIVSRMADDSLRLTLSLIPSVENQNKPVFSGVTEYRDETTKRYICHQVGNGLYPFRDEKTELWGYIDTSAKIVIPAKYNEVRSFKDGRALVANNYKKSSYKYSVIDTKGNVLYSDIEHISQINGMDEATSIAYKNQKHALFINNKLLTSFKYKSLNSLDGTYIKSETDNGYGVLDRTGKELVPCKYDYGIESNDNYFWAQCKEGKGYDVYTIDGKFVKNVVSDYLSITNSGLMSISKNDKYGLATLSGGEILEPLYDYCELSEDLAILSVGELTALAGENGFIFEFGEYHVQDIYKDVAIVFTSENEMAFADVNGIFTEKLNGYRKDEDCELLAVTDEAIYYCDGGYYHLYDRQLEKIAEHTGSVNSHFVGYGLAYHGIVSWENGAILADGWEKSYYYKSFSDDVVLQTKDNKYLLTSDVENPSFYSTKEEALAAYKATSSPAHYFISEENGKPIGCYVDTDKNITTVIKYYKNGVYYDEIVYIGEDYFACRFSDVWYLVHP